MNDKGSETKANKSTQPESSIVRVINGVYCIGNLTYSDAEFKASLEQLNRDWIALTKDDSDNEEQVVINELPKSESIFTISNITSISDESIPDVSYKCITDIEDLYKLFNPIHKDNSE